MAAEFSYQYLYHTLRDLLHAVKCYDMGPTALLPLPKEVVLRIFIALKNSSLLAEFKPANLESDGKHDNHYITDNDKCRVTYY
jgi:hypothetical protein